MRIYERLSNCERRGNLLKGETRYATWYSGIRDDKSKFMYLELKNRKALRLAVELTSSTQKNSYQFNTTKEHIH